MTQHIDLTPSPETTPAAFADAAATLEYLVTRGASYMYIRHSFAQQGSVAKGDTKPGVLGTMVSLRKRRALQLYLLLLAAWPTIRLGDPLPAAVWARALTTPTGRRWATANVSEAWGELVKLGLVERQRVARRVQVTPRREDAKAAYTPPDGSSDDPDETYFSVPATFWTDEWFERLSMPAIAMLLILASRTSKEPEVPVFPKSIAEWYGLSLRSVETGLAELKKVGLAEDRVDWVPAPLSAIGTTSKHYYQLTGEFSTEQRLQARKEARAEQEKRTRAEAAAEAKKKPKSKPKKKAGKKSAVTGTKPRKKSASPAAAV